MEKGKPAESKRSKRTTARKGNDIVIKKFMKKASQKTNKGKSGGGAP